MLNKKIILVLSFITLSIVVGFFSYKESEKLRAESFNLYLNTKNYPEAYAKYKQAAIFWPFLYFEEGYKNSLANFEQGLDRPSVIIFLKEQAQELEILKLKEEIEALKGVGKVVYISKTEADKRYLDSINDQALKDLYSPGILPASIEVYLDDFSIKEQVKEIAKSKSFVEPVFP